MRPVPGTSGNIISQWEFLLQFTLWLLCSFRCSRLSKFIQFCSCVVPQTQSRATIIAADRCNYFPRWIFHHEVTHSSSLSLLGPLRIVNISENNLLRARLSPPNGTANLPKTLFELDRNCRMENRSGFQGEHSR